MKFLVASVAAVSVAVALVSGIRPAAAQAPAPPAATILHVAPDGNDTWTGKSAAPNANRSDGPLATLEGARDAVRRLRAAGPVGPVTVRVRGGTYRMARPFVLEPQDSGTDAAPVVYEAQAGERPVFSGGRVLAGFRQNGPLWECEVPEVKAGREYFRQLFVSGHRRPRARAPDEGYFRVAGFLPPGGDAQGKEVPERSGFVFKPGDLKPWARLDDVNIVLMHSWEVSIHPVKSVDAAANAVRFSAPLKEWWTIGYWERAQRYYVENARELLDRPGEWYLDRGTGVLSYWPMPGERIGATEVVAPVLPELVRFAGRPDEGQFVRNVTLRGLAFHHADWALDPKGNSSTQAAVEVPAAIMADGALQCAIEGCEVARVGTYGIWLRRGCQDSRVERCRLFDLGAGGVRVGEAQMAKTDAAESCRNGVDNNHIYDGGKVYASGVGVWVAQSSHNRISHNDIHDFLYSGMSIGWNWDDAPNRTHHNVVEFNHIHHLVHGVLSDAGAIYTLGASPGSVLRNNVCHDVWPYAEPPFGWGIYLDATCSQYLVEENVVYNTQSGGLMYNNGGHEHVIRNNIFARSAFFALWPFWEKRPNTFERNLVQLSQGELFVPFAVNPLKQRMAAKESLGVWDRNLYAHPGGADALRFFKWDVEAWRQMGLDANSVIADPMFVNPEAGDFSLKPDSPALKLGFKPIDTSKVGLYGDAAWVAEARAVRHPPTVLPALPPPPKPAEVDDDFEGTPVGSPPRADHVDPDKSGASIRVTDEQAAGGKRSLKFTDTKALEPSWMPHLFYRPHVTEGVVRQAFDLRLEKDAKLFTEWRDEGEYPHCIGPSVSFDEAGRVVAGGKVLATLPIDRWSHIEIEAALGKSAPRTFTLTVTGPEGKKQSFADLSFVGKDFRELHWLGFSSTAAADCVWYLDNLKVKRVGK
jgi:hypothetical protein